MTLAEARAVALIVEHAEGGCGGCVTQAVNELNVSFPSFVWAAVEHPGFAASVSVEYRTVTAAQARSPQLSCYGAR